MNEYMPAIPFSWLTKMTQAIPRKRGKSSAITVCVVMALYYSWKIAKANEFKITHKTLERFGLNRKELPRILEALEKAGHVTVTKQPGQSPTITIVNRPPSAPVLSTRNIIEKETGRVG